MTCSTARLKRVVISGKCRLVGFLAKMAPTANPAQRRYTRNTDHNGEYRHNIGAKHQIYTQRERAIKPRETCLVVNRVRACVNNSLILTVHVSRRIKLQETVVLNMTGSALKRHGRVETQPSSARFTITAAPDTHC